MSDELIIAADCALSFSEHVRETLGRRPEHQRAIRPLLNELVRARQARL